MIFLPSLLLVALATSSFAAPAIKGRQTASSNNRPFYGTKGGQEGAASGQQEASLPGFVEPPAAPAPEPDAGEPMMPYSFEYTAEATGGMSARRESNDGQRVTGSYMIMGPDGLNRIVHYVADKDGFRATITTNEPGTESQSPAATLLNSSQLPAEQIALMYGPREPAPSAKLQQSPPIPALPAQVTSPPAPSTSARLISSSAPLPTTTLTSPAPSSPAAPSAPLRLLNNGAKGAPIVQQTKSLRSPSRSRPLPPPPPPAAPLIVVRAPSKAPPQRIVLTPPPPPPAAPLLPPPPPPAAPLPSLPLRQPSKASKPSKLNLQRKSRPFYIATTTTTTTTPPPPPPLLIVQQEQQQEEQQEEQQQEQQEEQLQEQVQEQQQEEQLQEQVQEVQQEEQQQEQLQEQQQEQEQEVQQSEQRYIRVYY